MPFNSQIGATRVVLFCAALVLGQSAVSQTQPEIRTQRSSDFFGVSDEVGRAQLDSFGPGEVTPDDFAGVDSIYESEPIAGPAEFVLPTRSEVPANRFESAPFDRSGSVLFRNSTGSNATGLANGYPLCTCSIPSGHDWIEGKFRR